MHTEIARDEIALKVRRTIADTLRIDVDHVGLDAALDEERLGIDSLRLIKLNVALEEAFDVALPDFTSPEGSSVRKVGDVVALVAARVEGGAR
jgi:acyl carrier protein